jgi:hypothetical protein
MKDLKIDRKHDGSLLKISEQESSQEGRLEMTNNDIKEDIADANNDKEN